MNARMTAPVVPWPRSAPRSAGPPSGARRRLSALHTIPPRDGRPASLRASGRPITASKYRDYWVFSTAAVGEPLGIVLRSTSKMTAVDQPNRSTPFMAVIGPISRQRSIGTTSPYPNVV